MAGSPSFLAAGFFMIAGGSALLSSTSGLLPAAMTGMAFFLVALVGFSGMTSFLAGFLFDDIDELATFFCRAASTFEAGRFITMSSSDCDWHSSLLDSDASTDFWVKGTSVGGCGQPKSSASRPDTKPDMTGGGGLFKKTLAD